MFGGLHIMGLAALKTTENLLESSWWTGELVQAGVAACGKAVVESLRAWDTLTMFEATVCGRS